MEVNDEMFTSYGVVETEEFYREIHARSRSKKTPINVIRKQIFDIIRHGQERREAAGLTPEQAFRAMRLATQATGQRHKYRERKYHA